MNMPPTSAVIVILSGKERDVLTRRAHAARCAHRDVLRARIVLAAAAGDANAAIAREVGVCEDTVRQWRHRFCTERLEGLKDRPRSGRPRVFTPVEVAQVKALACTRPADHGLPLTRWSAAELRAHAVATGLVRPVASATIGRWLAADAIKPWQHRSWIFPRDPDFAVKAARVLDLYHRRWNGVALGDDEYVISADEKSQLQALKRRHAETPARPGQPRRVEFEYRRGGTLAYFAAYDVHQARVMGMTAPTTGIAPFTELVEQVMTQEPYASAKRVFWVVDNGSSHAGQASKDRMRHAFPNAVLVHLPVHASWLNQVEIYFSILQRKAIATGDFADLDDLAARILAFQDRYNRSAEPFGWKYTRDDLNRHLDRLNNDGTLRAA